MPLPSGCEADEDISEDIGSADDHTIWTPLAWHYSPDQLIAQAKADNAAGYAGAFANAGKHSNPPAWNSGGQAR
jgi:hypothetical protein